MRRSIRRLTSLTVGTTLLFQSYAFAIPILDRQLSDTEVVQHDSGSREQQQQLQEFAAEQQPIVTEGMQAWGNEQEMLVPELLAAAARLDAEAERIMNLRGEEYLLDLINANHFIIEDTQLRIKMEYRLIDGHRVPRLLVHDQVYILVDEKIIPRDSKHLKQYIARTHHESGPNRVVYDENGNSEKTIFGTDKKRTGRDLTIVYLNDDVTNVDYLPKPKVTDWKWWSEYFVSKYKKPTIQDFTMALFTGVVMQGALTFAATDIKHHMLGTDFSMLPTYWTMGYGLLIGTVNSTVRNWTINSGTKLTRVLKSQAVSSLYAMGLVLAVTEGSPSEKLSTLSIFTAEGQAKNVSIVANGLMNNFAKDSWYQIPRIREATRENANNIPFLGWKQASLESQLLYLMPWSINIISLLTLASTDMFQIPGTNITIPILQFAGIPIAMYWSKWYSRRVANRFKNDPDAQIRAKELDQLAKTYENNWKSTFGMDVKIIPGKVSGLVRSLSDTAVNITKKCLNLLSGSPTTKQVAESVRDE